MKTLPFLNLLFFLASFGLVTVQPVYGRADLSKTLEYQFLVEKDAELIADHKYGKIHVTSSSALQQVKLRVEITVKGSDKKSEEYLNGISIESHQYVNKLTLSTLYTVVETERMKRSIQVDWFLEVPKHMAMEFKQKFGDFYLDESNNRFKLGLGYGNAKIGNLNGADNTLNVNFGNLDVHHIQKGTIDIQYGKFICDNAAEITVRSQFSGVQISQAGSLNFKSQYNDYKLGTIGALQGVYKFGNVDVDNILAKVTLEGSYGDVRIKSIQNTVEDINVNVKFGNATLAFNRDNSFYCDLKAQFGNIQLPESVDFGKEELKANAYVARGKLGGKGNRPLKVESNYGDVRLKWAEK